MARKGQFAKGGGRVGGTSHKRRSKRRRSTTALAHAPRTHTVYRTRTRTVHAKRTHRKRHGGGEGGVKLPTLALVGAGMAYVASEKSGDMTKMVRESVAKVPGVATFGPVAGLGALAFVVNKFVLKRPNKYLKAASIVGLCAAAIKIGEAGTDFKFVGDSDVGDYDVGDD